MALAAGQAVGTGNYFKLVLKRNLRVTANDNDGIVEMADGKCFDWGLDADELRVALAQESNGTSITGNRRSSSR